MRTLDQIHAMAGLLVAGDHFVFAADTSNKTAVSREKQSSVNNIALIFFSKVICVCAVSGVGVCVVHLCISS